MKEVKNFQNIILVCLPIPSGNGTKMVPAFEVYSCNASSLETADLTICGTDGISYKNECEFNRKKCQDPKCLEDGSNCIEKMCKGKCPCSEGCDSYNFNLASCINHDRDTLQKTVVYDR